MGGWLRVRAILPTPGAGNHEERFVATVGVFVVKDRAVSDYVVGIAQLDRQRTL